jgi:thiamine-phosphate pyrophosphorylase
MDLQSRLRKIDWTLYVIIDREWLKGRPVDEVATRVVEGGCGILQYRDKVSDGGLFYREALKLRRVTEDHGIPLIVNDRVDIALAVYADGVHLGQEDLAVDTAREIAGSGFIVGASVHRVDEYARVKHADYFGVGTVYQTKIKDRPFISGVGIVEKIRKLTDKPLVGIGGITVDNLSPVIQAGADGVAVLSGIMEAEDPREAARRYVMTVKNTRKRR